MLNQFLIIRLDNSKIDLANGISIPYIKTNLPKDSFNFRTHQPVIWKLEQKYYDSASGKSIVMVVDYDLPPTTTLQEQNMKYPIKNLIFEKLDWKKFEPLLYSYTLSHLKHIIFNYQSPIDSLHADLERTAPNLFFNKREPVIEEIEKEIKVKFDEATFDAEKIRFTIHLKPYKLVKQVEILNPHLRPEFEHIKPYFIKRFGKSFLAKVKLKLRDNTVEDIVVTSEDINSINEYLIDSIKLESALDLQQFRSVREDKVLYSFKELLEEEKKLSLLGTSAKEILEIFIKQAKVRNVRQLEYLSKNKQTLDSRLQFTTKPLFGFVFKKLDNNCCFIWELLNSHATYIWKVDDPNSWSGLGKIVEQAIATIRKEGRQAYKKYYKAIENPGYDFGIIDHSSTNLNDDERFNEWKNKLELFCK